MEFIQILITIKDYTNTQNSNEENFIEGVLETSPKQNDRFSRKVLATFSTAWIPERAHAITAGAYGTLTITNDITKFTKAKLFSELGKHTAMFGHFSTVAGEKGSADTVRGVRDFAMKF